MQDPRGSRMIEWSNLTPICCGEFQTWFSQWLLLPLLLFIPSCVQSALPRAAEWRGSQYVVSFCRYCQYDFSLVRSAGVWWVAHLCWNAGAHIQQILWSSEIWWVGSKLTLTITQARLEEQNNMKYFCLRWNTWEIIHLICHDKTFSEGCRDTDTCNLTKPFLPVLNTL